ncbi:MAG: InlB B-repeat-containing protein, partial [Butyrivibrio sp.]|nr:InlB B-repeat-containing protein [Butyrivibrio sp.]
VLYAVKDDDHNKKVTDKSNVIFKYEKEGTKELKVDHADLQFKEGAAVRDKAKNVIIHIDNKSYNMNTKYDDNGHYEIRYTTKTKTISSKSKIWFELVIDGQHYTTEEKAGEATNLEAYARCRAEHPGHIYDDVIGFDYEFSISDFKLEGGVTYYKNDLGVANADKSTNKAISVGEYTSTKDHTVLDYGAQALSSLGDKPAGKKFAGWNTKPDGSGTSYAAGSTVTLTKTVKSVSLYAMWNELPSVTVTVTGGEYTYDATAHEATLSVNDNYTVELKNGVTGALASATDYTQTPVPSDVDADDIVIKSSDGTTLTSEDVNISIEYDSQYGGAVKINKRDITLTSVPLSKEYDGVALTAAERAEAEPDTYTWNETTGVTNMVSVAGEFQGNDGYKVTAFTGSLMGNAKTETVEANANTFEYELTGGENVADNYNVTTEFGSLTVTAKGTVTVSFFIDGIHLEDKDQTVEKGGKALELTAGVDYEDKTDDGYTLNGWYTDPEFTEESEVYDFESLVEDDVQLYAAWVGDETTYTVEYYYQKVDGTWNKKADKKDPAVTSQVGEEIAPEFDDKTTYEDLDYKLDSQNEENVLTKVLTNKVEENVLKVYYARDGQEVWFFVLLPEKKVPGSGKPEPNANYYPYNGKGEWVGLAKPFVDPVYVDGTLQNPVYDVTGKEIEKYIIRKPVSDINSDETIRNYYKEYGITLTEADITWYAYKHEYYGTPHIDGYIKGISVDVTYHANYVGEPDPFTDENAVTGSYTILGQGNDGAAPLTVRDGWTFLGWAETQNVTENEKIYQPGDDFTLVQHKDFWARWEANDYNAYYKVEYFYQNADGTYPTEAEVVAAGDVSEVRQAEGTINFGLEEPVTELDIAVSDADKALTTHDELTYKLVDESINGKWSGTANKDNTEDAPAILKVYYARADFDKLIWVKAASDSVVYNGYGHNKPEAEIAVVTDTTNGETVTADSRYTVTATVELNTENEDKTITNVSENAEGNNLVKTITVTDTVEELTWNFTVTQNEDGVNIIDVTDSPFKNYLIQNGTVEITKRPVTLRSHTLIKEFDGLDLTAAERVAAAAKTGDDYDKYGDEKANVPEVTPFDAEKEVGFVEFEEEDREAEGLDIDATKAGFTGSITVAEKLQDLISKKTEGNEFEYVLLENTDAENYDITTVFGDLEMKDRSRKWIIDITIQADSEGDGHIKHIKYDGTVLDGNKNVIVTVKGKEERHEEDPENEPQSRGMFESIKTFFAGIGNLFNNAKGASEEQAEEHRKPQPVKAQTVSVQVTEDKTIDVTVDGMTVSGGSGIHVNLDPVTKENVGYPIYLDYTDTTIMTKINGADADIHDQFEIKIQFVETNGETREEVLTFSDDGQQNVLPEVETERLVDQIGCLYIEPRDVVLTSGSARRAYRAGQPLTAKNLTDKNKDVSKDRFVEGEGATGKNWASRTAVGTTKNTFDYDLTSATFADDYKIAKAFGTLTIYDEENIVPPPTDEDTTTTTPPPAQGQVLGARREGGDGAAVLGARRARTEDETASRTTRLLIIIIAAGAVATFIITGKRKKTEEEQ